MKHKIKAGIIGGSGYTGGELIRLLLSHPSLEISFVVSPSHAGNPVASLHPDLEGSCFLNFSEYQEQPADVIFLCLPHGKAGEWLQQNALSPETKIIDLSSDFRWKAERQTAFVYGLPELQGKKIADASAIANPGCFATAIQLCLLPLWKAGFGTEEIYCTGITGSTGAGKDLSETGHYSWRTNNISPYKVLDHQHLDEIKATGENIFGIRPSIHFVPWRGNFSRGIFVSCTLSFPGGKQAAEALFRSFYAEAPFVKISQSIVCLKQAVNTNNAFLSFDVSGGKLVAHAAIDNLLKGASGQAVQNMNLMFGLPEECGLVLKAMAY